MRYVDLLVIGGGSAGMAAAAAAYDAGVRDILLVERSDSLGGILSQCIHNGFGLHRYGKELTGPEYALLDIGAITARGIKYMLHSFVLSMTQERVVTIVSPAEGLFRISAGAVILAMGCRERTRGALMIPGTRPAGVITAGAAQKYLNLKGYLPGKDVVILGSGDIGLIMARQLVLEGVRVREVVEILPYSAGLGRNIVQCLHDFGIPLTLSSTVTEIRGRRRVSSVVVSRVDEERRPVPGTEREIPCDTLMISAGLIPENEISRSAGIVLSRSTKGPVVNEHLQTSVPGVFACGNVLHVHDLVDNVSEEGRRAGENAALFIRGAGAGGRTAEGIPVREGPGVRALVPQFITGKEDVRIAFRPCSKMAGAVITVSADGHILREEKRRFLTPGEMCGIRMPREKLMGIKELSVGITETDIKEAGEAG